MTPSKMQPASRDAEKLPALWWLRRRRVGFAIAFVALCAIFHAKLLTCVAYPLTTQDPVAKTDAKNLLFLRSAKSSTEAFAYATTFAKSDPIHRVLVLKDYVRRSEEIGAYASFVGETVAMLEENGVPAEQIEVIGDGQVITMGEQMKYASDWLSEQPESVRLNVVTWLFETGFVRTCADQFVAPNLRPRLRVCSFNRAGLDETNWWKSSRGIKWCVRAYLRLIHLHIFGSNRPNVTWDPDVYEAELLDRLKSQPSNSVRGGNESRGGKLLGGGKPLGGGKLLGDSDGN